MDYIVVPEVWSAYPDLKTGLITAIGVRNVEGHQAVEAILRQAEERVKSAVPPDGLSQHHHVAAWRKAYSRFGVTPSQYRNAAEALARRVLRDGAVARINALVDLANAFSLRCLLPVAVWNLDKVEGDMVIRFARGDEPFTDLASGEVSYPAAGEVIYGDDRRALSRRWNWRSAVETVATLETTNALVTVEGLGPGAEVVEQTAGELAAIVERHLGGQVRWDVLSRGNQRARVLP